MSTKVVSAVGNKALERLISSIETVDVLSTVRKKEQVIDAVIRFNPHVVILSRELGGKGDLLEVVQRCRIVADRCKIVFVYGNKDEDFRQVFDFLRQQDVGNILVGAIDHDLLQDAIERNCFPEEGSLLEDPTTAPESWSPPPSVPPLKQPEETRRVEDKEEELLLNEKMQRLLDRQTPSNARDIAPVMIAVASLQKRGGATHLSLEAAAELARQRHNVGVLTDRKILDAMCQANGLENLTGTVTLNGVTLFCDRVMLRRFDVVVLDMGQIAGKGYIEFFQAQYRLLCCGTAPWELPELMEFIEDNRDVAGTVEYILFPVGGQQGRQLTEILHRSGCRAYPWSCNPEPLAKHKENIKAFRRMLQSLRSK